MMLKNVGRPGKGRVRYSASRNGARADNSKNDGLPATLKRSEEGGKCASAEFSACRQYRYELRRTWQAARPAVMFVGLNPSTADELRDDPTVRRCIGFARSWGFGSIVLVNLFAYRSTDPVQLAQVTDPIGPDNDNWIKCACEYVELIVAAWGVHGSLNSRDEAVLSWLPPAHCLGTTKAGAPRHPLYLAADTPLRLFSR